MKLNVNQSLYTRHTRKIHPSHEIRMKNWFDCWSFVCVSCFVVKLPQWEHLSLFVHSDFVWHLFAFVLFVLWKKRAVFIILGAIGACNLFANSVSFDLFDLLENESLVQELLKWVFKDFDLHAMDGIIIQNSRHHK